MSSQNVERWRSVIEAFNTRDIEAMIAYADPSIEFHSAFAEVGGVYHGRAGMRRWVQDFEEVWGHEIRLEPQAYFDLGGHTLALNVLHGRGRQSGADVTMPIAIVARWVDGLIVFIKGHAHREDALSDLGVSEDELEPIDP
jgi:hypothetical protein